MREAVKGDQQMGAQVEKGSQGEYKRDKAQKNKMKLLFQNKPGLSWGSQHVLVGCREVTS